jgi:hypothetical protein
LIPPLSPFALSLSKGRCRRVKSFDKLSPNGIGELSPNGTHIPFALSLSKGRCRRVKGFDKLSPNGTGCFSPNGFPV